MAETALSFADWLTATGRALGYTSNSAIARALGVPQSTISRWKAGSRPGIEQLLKVSELFGVELKSLLVLAGYVDPGPGEEGEPKAKVQSIAQKTVSEARIPDSLKNALWDFVEDRREEEAKRLELLVSVAEDMLERPRSHDDPAKTVQVMATRIDEHVLRTIAIMQQAIWNEHPDFVQVEGADSIRIYKEDGLFSGSILDQYGNVLIEMHGFEKPNLAERAIRKLGPELPVVRSENAPEA